MLVPLSVISSLKWAAAHWVALAAFLLIVVHDLWPGSKGESVLRDVVGAAGKLARRGLSKPLAEAAKAAPGPAPIPSAASRVLVLVDHTRSLSPAWLKRVCDAITVQLGEFASEYGVQPWSIQPYQTGSIESPIVAIFSKLTVPGALGYHDVGPNGLPYADVALEQDTSLDDLTETISHEALELVGDIWADRWRVDADSGVAYAEEACDPVQGSPYTIAGVRVANFVLPAWYNARAKTKRVDWLGRLSGPHTRLNGGYFIEMTGGVVDTVPAQAKEVPRKKRANARTRRRLESGCVLEIAPSGAADRCAS